MISLELPLGMSVLGASEALRRAGRLTRNEAYNFGVRSQDRHKMLAEASSLDALADAIMASRVELAGPTAIAPDAAAKVLAEAKAHGDSVLEETHNSQRLRQSL